MYSACNTSRKLAEKKFSSIKYGAVDPSEATFPKYRPPIRTAHKLSLGDIFPNRLAHHRIREEMSHHSSIPSCIGIKFLCKYQLRIINFYRMNLALSCRDVVSVLPLQSGLQRSYKQSFLASSADVQAPSFYTRSKYAKLGRRRGIGKKERIIQFPQLVQHPTQRHGYVNAYDGYTSRSYATGGAHQMESVRIWQVILRILHGRIVGADSATQRFSSCSN